jgi:hypothetical protein
MRCGYATLKSLISGTIAVLSETLIGVHTPSNRPRTAKSSYLDPAGTQSWLAVHLESTGLDTLGRLAEVSGVNKGTLSRYFRQTQRPSVDTLVILCKSLNVTPSELLYGLGALPFEDQ